jgi:hypothetical protein
MQQIIRVIREFEDITTDIENVLGKPFLKTAIVSHIKRATKLPEEFVREVVEVIYLSDNL